MVTASDGRASANRTFKVVVLGVSASIGASRLKSSQQDGYARGESLGGHTPGAMAPGTQRQSALTGDDALWKRDRQAAFWHARVVVAIRELRDRRRVDGWSWRQFNWRLSRLEKPLSIG